MNENPSQVKHQNAETLDKTSQNTYQYVQMVNLQKASYMHKKQHGGEHLVTYKSSED